jgi:tetratricopeptide (TPR) repeat protein
MKATDELIERWLNELETEPRVAIQKLILGMIAIPAWSRASLREIFVEVYQTDPELLDRGLTEWLEERLLKLPPEQTPTVAWATDLREVFRAVTGLPLKKLARLLRDRMRDFLIWLAPLSTNKRLDPKAAYLAALGWSETNQHLEGFWHRLALNRGKEPMYYIDIGLLGLRKGRDEQGHLPPEAPTSLLAALIALADVPGVSRKHWLLTTRATLGGYIYSQETWAGEFDSVLETLPEAKNARNWLSAVFPTMKKKRHGQNCTNAFRPIPLSESQTMIEKVSQQGTIVDGLEQFLNRHRVYANATQNSHYIVRTFNRLAEAARMHDPNWAVARAEEALEWDRSDARNWTVLARCLWTRALRANKAGDFSNSERDSFDAIDILWEARRLFPWDSFVRNELARLCRDAGDLDTADKVYRETMVHFPKDVACRNGLAEVLREKGLIDEAIQLYRAIESEFPKNSYAFSGLSTILFHRSAANQDEQEREEARALLKKAADLKGNDFTHMQLYRFDKSWNLLASHEGLQPEEDEEVSETLELKQIKLSEMRPAQRLGRSLLLQWQARQAESFTEREHLFGEAGELLNLQEELMGECLTAFIEARGFLMIARGWLRQARDFIEGVAASYRNRGMHVPLGIRLGLAEACSRLGESISPEDNAALMSLGADGSILPLVLRVILLLRTTTDDTELRKALMALYPRVQNLSRISIEGEESKEFVSADHMMAQLLTHDVFQPLSINKVDDIQADESVLSLLRDRLSINRDNMLSVVQDYALAA